MRPLNFHEAPPSGRRETLQWALEELHLLQIPGPILVEVGTMGKTFNPNSHGWSTRLFAWYVHTYGGQLITIDPNSRAISWSKRSTILYRRSVIYEKARAEKVIGNLKHIDFLYMDGPPDPHTHRRIWDAVKGLPSLVLWDDITEPWTTWRVKGAATIPAMIQQGYEVRFAEQRQALLVRS